MKAKPATRFSERTKKGGPGCDLIEAVAKMAKPARVTLPLSFQSSFWSPDYRKGVEALFNKLQAVRRP